MSIAEPRDLIEVLQRMEYWRQEPSVDTKRHFKRFSVRGDAALEPIQTEQMLVAPLSAMLRDISRGGVGFLTEQYLDKRSLWRIVFFRQGMRVGGQPLSIRYCRLVQDGLYLCGGQFVIEPYLMDMLGVPSHEMTEDLSPDADTNAGADFVDPTGAG